MSWWRPIAAPQRGPLNRAVDQAQPEALAPRHPAGFVASHGVEPHDARSAVGVLQAWRRWFD